MMKAKAYVKDNRLFILGLSEGTMGTVPIIYHVALPEPVPDGAVDLNALSPIVEKALQESEEILAQQVETEQMRLAAESLVTRARKGDQNAMGMIATVAEAAQSGGNERAELAYNLLLDYTKKHPHNNLKALSVPSDIKISREIVRASTPTAISALVPGVQDLYVVAIILANGEMINREMLDSILSTFADEYEQHAFKLGITFGTALDVIAQATQEYEGSQLDALRTGCCVGLARRLQIARLPGTPIKIFSPIAGWELGE